MPPPRFARQSIDEKPTRGQRRFYAMPIILAAQMNPGWRGRRPACKLRPSLQRQRKKGRATNARAFRKKGRDAWPRHRLPPKRDRIKAFTPALVDYTNDVIYGDLWERKALSKRDRSLITVAALVATYRHGAVGVASDACDRQRRYAEEINEVSPPPWRFTQAGLPRCRPHRSPTRCWSKATGNDNGH